MKKIIISMMVTVAMVLFVSCEMAQNPLGYVDYADSRNAEPAEQPVDEAPVEEVSEPVESPETEVVETEPETESLIGTIGAGGGYIFYAKDEPSDGWQYAEVSMFDLTSGTGVTWYEAQTMIADYSSNGVTDWTMPTIDDLILIDTNLHSKHIGYLNASYWSSTGTDNGAILLQVDGTGTLYWMIGKNNGIFVRAVHKY